MAVATAGQVVQAVQAVQAWQLLWPMQPAAALFVYAACACFYFWPAWAAPAAGAGPAAGDDGSAWAVAYADRDPPAAPPADSESVWPAHWPCSAPASAA